MPPTPPANYYDYIATTGNRAIRVSYGATSPRISAYSDFWLNTHALGGALPEDRHTLTASEAVALQGLAGDVWVKLYANDGHTIVGWTAKTHKGAVQITEKLVEVMPVPVELSIFVTETVTDVLEIKQADGTLKKYSSTWTDSHEYKPFP
jgi:hypothetical protein